MTGEPTGSRAWMAIVALGVLIPIAFIVITRLEQQGWWTPAPEAAPEFDVPLLVADGRATLAASRGRPMLINFWASWCTLCKSELPLFQVLGEQARGWNGVILAVATADEQEAATAAIRQQPRTFPVAYDVGGMAANYGVRALPQTLLIDRDGFIVRRYARPLTTEDLPTVIAHLR
jgi:cytochrome c biogenesis protein CcmG/thiol:disulfide interchange protein DsbE